MLFGRFIAETVQARADERIKKKDRKRSPATVILRMYIRLYYLRQAHQSYIDSETGICITLSRPQIVEQK